MSRLMVESAIFVMTTQTQRKKRKDFSEEFKKWSLGLVRLDRILK
jgi:hypothetical protein